MNDSVNNLDFCTIASGSSGNCIYIGMGGKHFLVDAGISGKRIENALFEIGVRNIDGIFLTHEHRDHITGAGVMARRFKLKLYASPLTWAYFADHQSLGALDAHQINVIHPDRPIDIDGVTVTAFNICHDAAQPVGYTFTKGDRKVAVATDFGQATDTVMDNLCNCQIILLESNHDPHMLENGPYPRVLKNRVAGQNGHLSNGEAGMLLAKVAGDTLEHVFLAHLSEDNNTPVVAYDTVSRVLEVNNIQLKTLTVASRHKPGELIKYGN